MSYYGNSLIRFFYYNSPPIIKNIIATSYGLKAIKDRYGEFYKKWLNFLEKSQYLPNEFLINFRNLKTIDFVNQALRLNSFLRNFYGVDKIDNIEDLKTFPLIDKDFLRKNLDKIKIKRKGEKIRISHSSGTTGSAIIFPITLECFQREYAFRALHYKWSGVDLDKRPRIAIFSGHPVANVNRSNPPFWVYDFANNWLLFSSYHLSDNLLTYYINELVKFQPELIHGYPSSIYLVAIAYKKYGKTLKNLKAVYTASETLLDFQRKVIEDAFQVKVFNWYGNSEMCANIVECEKGRLHLKFEHSFVEILNDKNEECKPGEKGRLVCTGFGNIAFPLIRYDIKDEVIISEEQSCPCGRGGVIIKEIIGRIEDYIITPSGRRIGRLDHLFKDTVGIKEAQIYQNKIDEVEIRVVPETGQLNKDDEEKILKECNLRFGKELKVKIEVVEEIPRGPNNKFRFVICEIN